MVRGGWQRWALALGAVTAVLALSAPAAGAAGPLLPGLWLTSAEIARLPEHGAAWQQLRQVANEPMGHANLSDQDSTHDTHVLAAALVYARTGEERFRVKAAAGIMDAIDTERGGRTLSLARGLVSYVVAADLIDMRRTDPDRERVFAAWLSRVRRERLKPASRPTLILTHERAPNNWGAHAGASRIAADIYLGDTRDLARAAAVFKGYLGDQATYHAFRYGDDLSWQADRKHPVGVDPPGARRAGRSIDGALPDDMRRGCSARFPPCPTLYPWEAMQGAVVQAELLSRQGYDAWNWGHQALRRAATFLYGLHGRYRAQQWGAPAGDAWIPWLLNARYGSHFPTVEPAPPGKGMGFTDWTVAARPECRDQPCTTPRGAVRAVAAVAGEPPGRGGGGGGGGWAVVAAVAAAGTLGAAALAWVARRGRRRGRGSGSGAHRMRERHGRS
jgi:hypothetical protein